MTRSFMPRRARVVVRVARPARDPAISRLGFTMYRLEPDQNHAPDEPAWVPVQVIHSRNAMSTLTLL